MAFMFVSDPTAAGFNSYASVQEADDYFDGRQGASGGNTWDPRERADKERLLASATRLLDSHIVWTGWTSDQAQPLAWPREGMYDPIHRNSVPRDTIHHWIKNATAEFAEQLAAGDRAADSALVVRDVKSMDAGVKYSFGDPKVQVIPDAVWYWIDQGWYTSIRDRHGDTGQIFQAY